MCKNKSYKIVDQSRPWLRYGPDPNNTPLNSRRWLWLNCCRTGPTKRDNLPYPTDVQPDFSDHWRFSNCYCSTKTIRSCNDCFSGSSSVGLSTKWAMFLCYRSILEIPKQVTIILLFRLIFVYIIISHIVLQIVPFKVK